MNPLDHLAELMAKATPLPWTADFLGGRELGDGGIMAELESASSPFCRATHEDDEAFAVAAINAHPVFAEIARASQVVIAARHGATFPQWVAANDTLAAALAKLNPKETT